MTYNTNSREKSVEPKAGWKISMKLINHELDSIGKKKGEDTNFYYQEWKWDILQMLQTSQGY